MIYSFAKQTHHLVSVKFFHSFTESGQSCQKILNIKRSRSQNKVTHSYSSRICYWREIGWRQNPRNLKSRSKIHWCQLFSQNGDFSVPPWICLCIVLIYLWINKDLSQKWLKPTEYNFIPLYSRNFIFVGVLICKKIQCYDISTFFYL